MQPLRYWIHGPKGSGKTELAMRISGLSHRFHTDGATSTKAALERELAGNKLVVIDNYQPTPAKDALLRSAALNQSITKDTTGKGKTKIIDFNIAVLVATSEHKPADPALASRFFIIELTPTDRLKKLDPIP